MPEFIFKLLSWLYPIRVETTSSKFTSHLEVVWYNGKKMLNSKDANYSYGNLLTAFKQCLKSEYLNYSPVNILVLGFGAGSVPAYLAQKYPKAHLTGIEIDPEVVRIYHDHFDPVPNLNLVNDDAIQFLKATEKKFDLILIDLYIDLKVPSIFSSNEFAQLISDHLTKEGTMIFNQVINDSKDKEQWNDLQANFSNHFKAIRSYQGSFINNFLIANN